MNPNYTKINAENELADPDSVYNYTAKMVKLRSKTPTFVYGDCKDLAPDDPAIFAYTRTLGAEKYLVVLNFSDKAATFAVPDGLQIKDLLIGNLATGETGATLNLKGREARVYRF